MIMSNYPWRKAIMICFLCIINVKAFNEQSEWIHHVSMWAIILMSASQFQNDGL